MIECYSEEFFRDGQLRPRDDFDNALIYEGRSIYEVVRLRKGIPLFWENHAQRLENTARLAGEPGIVHPDALLLQIKELSRREQILNGNVKIVYRVSDKPVMQLLYFIEVVYPSEEMYRNGVPAILYRADRKNPRAKIIQHALRTAVYKRLLQTGRYEALLVNKEHCVTEGSRSNVFFIEGDRLVTAGGTYVLEGITRNIVLELCKEIAIQVTFCCYPIDRISRADGIFLTGTTPGVLPVASVGEQSFNPRHPLIARMREVFQLKENDYISTFNWPE